MDKYYFYQSYHEALKGIKPATRYIIREAIDNFMFEDKEPVFKDLLARSIWSLMLPTLKNSKVKYNNGKSRGRTEANQEQNPKQTESKSEAKRKQNGSKTEAHTEFCPSISISKEKEKGKGNKEKKDKEKTPAGALSAKASSLSLFIKPTVDDVRAYCEENGYKINPNEFVDFYESKGWLVGKVPMKDWRAAVRTWASKDRQENPAKYTEEKPQKKIEPITQCDKCESYNVRFWLDRCICNGCGRTWDWIGGKWKVVE